MDTLDGYKSVPRASPPSWSRQLCAAGAHALSCRLVAFTARPQVLRRAHEIPNTRSDPADAEPNGRAYPVTNTKPYTGSHSCTNAALSSGLVTLTT